MGEGRGSGVGVGRVVQSEVGVNVRQKGVSGCDVVLRSRVQQYGRVMEEKLENGVCCGEGRQKR